MKAGGVARALSAPSAALNLARQPVRKERTSVTRGLVFMSKARGWPMPPAGLEDGRGKRARRESPRVNGAKLGGVSLCLGQAEERVNEPAPMTTALTILSTCKAREGGREKGGRGA